MHTAIQLLTFCAALVAIAPASAELYKWVDERGVTNYSNTPPPNPAAAKKLTGVENKISVYTPDESFMQAVKALRERSIKALTEPEPPRQQVVRIPPLQPSPYENCLAAGRVGCDDLYASYYPSYLPGAVFFPTRGVYPTRFLTPPAPRATPARVSRAAPLRP